MTTPSPGPTGTALMKATEVAFVASQSDESGGVYSGRLLNNKRDGNGVLTWRVTANGPADPVRTQVVHGSAQIRPPPPQVPEGEGECSYDGEWRDGMMHGSGVYRWPDGTTYVGNWRNGKRHGEGLWHRTDGGWFEGIYLDNKWKSGTWHDPDGAQMTYAESWVWNAETSSYQVQGRGVHRRKKVVGGKYGVWDTVYDGDWAGGLMHGRGTLKSLETGEGRIRGL
ncbi:hypothetical protein Pelo_19062 [Pelomyxa schiedti]|nr:hypothetical protein Pelo_19062 [Pelomyxa schiedti]